MQVAYHENGSTLVVSIITRIYYIRMEVIDNDQYRSLCDKHTSLLRFRINYGGKNIVVQALRSSYKVFYKRNYRAGPWPNCSWQDDTWTECSTLEVAVWIQSIYIAIEQNGLT